MTTKTKQTVKVTKVSGPKASAEADAKRAALKEKLAANEKAAKSVKEAKKEARKAKVDSIEQATGTPLKAKERKHLVNDLGFDLIFSEDDEGKWVTFHIVGRNAWIAMPRDADGKKVMMDFTDELRAHVEGLIEAAVAAKAA